jgi:hypothetical protein
LRGKKKVDAVWGPARTKEGAKKTVIEAFKLFGITMRAAKVTDGHKSKTTGWIGI